LDRQHHAEKVVAQSRHAVDSIVGLVGGKQRGSLFFQIGANPLFTVTPNTFMDDYIAKLGYQNIAVNINKGIISREFVVAQNPDAIFISSMGMVGEAEKQTWEKFSGLKAVANNMVFVVDADMACSPTPITFVQTLKTMAGLLRID
jgi:ABC-type Fe3+-hydroxamate transport system substrate-binding protein